MILQYDRHSYYRHGQPTIYQVNWAVTVDFSDKVLTCAAEIRFDGVGRVSLDTRDLDIQDITVPGTDVSVPFEMGERHDILGSSLNFVVPERKRVIIRYRTSPNASALQWLSPRLTADKTHPFLFTQGEMIHTRSILPCQDTPGVRFNLYVELTVPAELRGLVAAPVHIGRTVDEDNEHWAIERWEMPYPIPSYLVGFAVGRLESRALDDRITVWAESSVIDKAAAEFEDLPRIMTTAEGILGEYPWDKYGVLIMPPSFPYGGMENPCLSFLTPALLVGDKSGVSVVAHELAHSWTGNLVTNATWADFWLNEGWTVYAEFWIVAAVFGLETAMVNLALLQREFDRDVERFSTDRPLFSALRPDLDGIDPDDVFSRVPYFKGAMLLLTLEREMGKKDFAEFVQAYIAQFRFTSITTAQFVDFLSRHAPGVIEELNLWEWIYEGGMPEDAFEITSAGITEVEDYVSADRVPAKKLGWTNSQLMLYMESLPRPCQPSVLRALDERFGLSMAANAELRWAYLMLAVESGDTSVYQSVGDFLHAYGRAKYVTSLFRELVKTQAGRSFAVAIFREVRGGQHSGVVEQVRKILNTAGV